MSIRNQSINLLGYSSGTPYAAGSDTDSILLSDGGGAGSTNTGVVIFDNLPASTDTYTVASSAADGSSVKIARSGIYYVQAQYAVVEESATTRIDTGITVDSTDLTTSFSVLADYTRGYASLHSNTASDEDASYMSAIVVVNAADAANAAAAIVRLQIDDSTNQDTTNDTVYLRLTRLVNFSG